MADQPSLTVLGGPLGGRRFAFEDGAESVLIGSDPSCTFRLELPGVSPIHARARLESGTIIVYDTQSPRGLFVNDDRVTTQMPIRNGDILWLGTPGEPGVVMIQCRVSPSASTSEGAAATPVPPVGTEATQAVSFEEVPLYAEPIVEDSQPSPTLAIAPEPEPMVEPEPEPFGTAEPTLIQSPPTPEGTDSFFGEAETQSMPAPTVPASTPAWDERSENELPTSFTVEPTLMTSAPAPPLAFEDETAEPAAEDVPTVMMAPPAAPEPPAPQSPAPAPPPPAPSPRPAAPRPGPSAPARPPAARPGPPSVRVDAGPRPRPGTQSMPPRPAAAVVPRRAAKSGGGGKGALIAIGTVVLLGAIVGGVYFFVLKPGGTQTVTRTPAPAAATTAPTAPPDAATSVPTTAPTEVATPVEVVTMVDPAAATAPPTSAPTSAATPTKATPTTATPTKAATAAATQAPGTPNPAALAAAARGQADRALAGGQYDAAVGHFDEALRLNPADAEATAGRAKAVAMRDALKRRFVPSVTSVKSGKQGKANLTGFESADVKVAGALEYSGRIDFEVKPERVKPGDSYVIRVFLTNDGKKDLKIGSVSVNYVSNGNKSGGPVNARVKQVEPQANVLLEEFPGVWNEGTTSWNMEVVVASNRGDTFSNKLTWK